MPTDDFVYELLSDVLSNQLESLNMTRVKRISYPSWRSDDRESLIFFSLQIDSKATDPFTGRGFRLEMENSYQRTPARGLNGRALFFQLLYPQECDMLLSQQNMIISSLEEPPSEQIELYPAGLVRNQYLKYFDQQNEFSPISSWLRYTCVSDVEEWAKLLTPLVRPLIDRARMYLSPDQKTLGRGCLLPL